MREGFWPACLCAGSGSSVRQSRHGLVQAACWAQHPGCHGGLSAGSRLCSGVLEVIGAGKVRGRQREPDKHLSGVWGRAKKGSPSEGPPRSSPATPPLGVGAQQLPQVGPKVKTLLIGGPPGAPSKPRESLEPQGLSSGPRARAGEQDYFSRATDLPGPCRPRWAGRNSSPHPRPGTANTRPCLCMS